MGSPNHPLSSQSQSTFYMDDSAVSKSPIQTMLNGNLDPFSDPCILINSLLKLQPQPQPQPQPQVHLQNDGVFLAITNIRRHNNCTNAQTHSTSPRNFSYKCTVSDGVFETSASITLGPEQKQEQEWLLHCSRSGRRSRGRGKGRNRNRSNNKVNRGITRWIAVTGYTSSMANDGMTNPFLCIHTFRVLEPKDQRITDQTQPLLSHQQQRHTIPAGNVVSFFSGALSFLSNDDLAGENAIFDNTSTLDPNVKKSLQDLVRDHSAIMTIHDNSATSFLQYPKGSTQPAEAPTAMVAIVHYTMALEQFSESQQNRQVASLHANIVGTEQQQRQTNPRADQVQEQYIETLQMALAHAESSTKEYLTFTVLQDWHSTLCGQGLHPEPGMIRTRNVRKGNTVFIPKERLMSDLQKIFPILQQLEIRLLRTVSNNGSNNLHSGIEVATFAAAAMFAIIDIHPFVDGSGRLSRIVANWALRRGGVPFVINFFATSSQRKEYIRAIQTTRRNSSLVAHGTVPEYAIWEASRHAGALLPLVTLLLDRVHKALGEFRKIVKEKSQMAVEEAEAKAARRFRERAAEGVCLICFENHPNIATLCCGTAVHLNCIAEWLSKQSTCPQCRAALPTLQQRDTVDLTHSSRTQRWFEIESNNVSQNEFLLPWPFLIHSLPRWIPEPADSEEESAASIDDVEDVEDHPPRRVLCDRQDCFNRVARDCLYGLCGRCCALHGDALCLRHARG